MDLLRERADRRDRRVRHAHAGRRVARPGRQRRGLGWASSPSRARCSCSCTRSSRETKRAGARRRSSRCLIGSAVLIVAVRGRRARAGAADARPDAVSRARLHGGEHRRVHAVAARSSRCSCTSRSTSRTCSATARCRPACDSCRSTLLSFMVAPIAGRLSVRVPVRLLLGSGCCWSGAGLLAMTAVDASSGWTALIPGFVLAGAGIGLVNPPLASTAIGVVPRRAAAWRRASTRPSARSASPPASPASARSSSTASPTTTAPRWPRARPAPSTRAAHGKLGDAAGVRRSREIAALAAADRSARADARLSRRLHRRVHDDR